MLGDTARPSTPTLWKGGDNATLVSQNPQKVTYLTQGHTGTKWQSWIRTQERPPRGLTLVAHHQAASRGRPGTPTSSVVQGSRRCRGGRQLQGEPE